MPIYQYHCPACDQKVDVFFRSASKVEDDPACPQCGKHGLARLMSAFARVLSSTDRLSSIDLDAEAGQLNDRDPASFARWAKRVGREYDEQLGTDFAARADSADEPVSRIDAAHSLSHHVQEGLHGAAADPLDDAMRGAGGGSDHAGHEH